MLTDTHISVNICFLYQLGPQIPPSRSSRSIGEAYGSTEKSVQHTHSLRPDWSAVGTLRQDDVTGSPTGGPGHVNWPAPKIHILLWEADKEGPHF